MAKKRLWLEDADIFDTIKKLTKYTVAYHQSDLDVDFEYMRRNLKESKNADSGVLKRKFVVLLRESGTNCYSVFDLLDENSNAFSHLKFYLDQLPRQDFFVEITSEENGKATGSIIEINGVDLQEEFLKFFDVYGKKDVESVFKKWMIQEWMESLDKNNYYSDLSLYTEVRRCTLLKEQAKMVIRLAEDINYAKSTGQTEKCGIGGADLLVKCEPAFSKLINIYDDLSDFMNALPFESAQATLTRNFHGFVVAVKISHNDLIEYFMSRSDTECCEDY